MTPIQLYTYRTPNGHKASIMLEETDLPYDVHVVDIENGEQQAPAFLALNPNGKIPVIVDPGRDRTVFESGAILFYLAERSGVLRPETAEEQDVTLRWVLFQAAHVGPTLGQLWNWKIFASSKPPQVVAYFEREATRVLRVLDGRLSRHAYLTGTRYGIADVMTWPWINVAEPKLGLDFRPYPSLRRWFGEIAGRPAVRRGLAVPDLSAAEAA
jgi:GST-like protein